MGYDRLKMTKAQRVTWNPLEDNPLTAQNSGTTPTQSVKDIQSIVWDMLREWQDVPRDDNNSDLV